MIKLVHHQSLWLIAALAILVVSPGKAQEVVQNSAPEAVKEAGQEALIQRSPSDLPNLDDVIMYDIAMVPKIADGRFLLPELAAPSTSTDDVGNGRTPDGIRDDDFAVHPLPETGDERLQGWNWTVCQWAAPNTFSNPRYYEDRMLERHGHQRFGCYLQPFASGVRFISDTLLLPYEMAIRPGCDCEYTLGYYRPGTQVPGFFQRPPYDRDALIIQSAYTAGAMIILP